MLIRSRIRYRFRPYGPSAGKYYVILIGVAAKINSDEKQR